ncbi:MAG: hypothetical protein ACR2OO_16210, partial [Thermomicrobiales bacterium]
IWGIREVLHRFGYFRRGFATEKADQLAGLFDNDGLILCELIDRQLLDDLLPEELAEVFSWFSFDRDFRYTNHFTLPDQLVLLRRRMEDLEHAVLNEERDNSLYISEGHNASFYGAAGAWCRGLTMVEIGAAIELSEGDLVMTFNKTIDLMRQLREMLADVLPDHPLRQSLRDAEKLLRRGIVEQSLTLGFAPIASPVPPPVDPQPDPPPPEAPKKRTRKPKEATQPVPAASAPPEAATPTPQILGRRTAKIAESEPESSVAPISRAKVGRKKVAPSVAADAEIPPAT